MSEMVVEEAVADSRRVERRSLSPGRRMLIWALLCAGMVGLAEAGASLIYYLRLSAEEREAIESAIGLREAPTNTVLRFTAHPYFNYVANPSFAYDSGYRPHNALGFRGEGCCAAKQPGHLRIVAIGGSTTYGLYFTYGKNVWPALVQDRLRRKYGDRIEVINAGIPNYTTFELIGLTAMILPELSPDVVLIHTGLNDAFAVGYPDEGGPDNRFFRHAWDYRPISERLARGMRASYIIRLAGASWGSANGFWPGDMAGSIQYRVPEGPELARHTAAATGKYFRRNIETLVALCRGMNAVPVLLTEPINPAKEVGLNEYYQAVVAAVSRNNAIMKELGEQRGLVVVDLYTKMRDPALFLDAAHETKAGMEEKAVEVAAALGPTIESLLSPPRRR